MIKKKADDKEQWFIYRANLRTKTLVIIGLAALIIISIFVCGYFIRDIPTNFANAMQMPSIEHPFGTDWMGRDMLHRTIAGLGLSLMVGFIASVVSNVWRRSVWCNHGCRVDSLDTTCKSSQI